MQNPGFPAVAVSLKSVEKRGPTRARCSLLMVSTWTDKYTLTSNAIYGLPTVITLMESSWCVCYFSVNIEMYYKLHYAASSFGSC